MHPVKRFKRRMLKTVKRTPTVHFVTYTSGRLLLGIAIGGLLFGKVATPGLVVLLTAGILLQVPFMNHVYFRDWRESLRRSKKDKERRESKKKKEHLRRYRISRTLREKFSRRH